MKNFSLLQWFGAFQRVFVHKKYIRDIKILWGVIRKKNVQISFVGGKNKDQITEKSKQFICVYF